MKILVTGKNGQLGKSIHKIITGNEKNSEFVFVGREELDLSSQDSIIDYFNNNSFDIIINCAAMTNVDACEENHTLAHEINVVGVQNIIKATRKRVKIIQMSTDYVFEGKDGPYCETSPTHPISYYGRSKLEAENILRGALHPYSIIRGSVLYGDPLNAKSNFFAWVYDSLSKNKDINVVTDQTSNPAWLPSLSDAIMKIILLNGEGVYHFGSDDYLNRYDFAVLIATVFGFDTDLITPATSDSMPFIARRPAHSGLKTKKISEKLDVITRPTIECLKMIKKQILVT